jgi:hypothetical protein
MVGPQLPPVCPSFFLPVDCISTGLAHHGHWQMTKRSQWVDDTAKEGPPRRLSDSGLWATPRATKKLLIHTFLFLLQTVVRGSSVPVDGYISGLLNDIQKLSVTSSNTLRGRSPTSRRRAQSLGLLGDEHWAADPDMYLQSPQSERTDPHGLYLSCNGVTPAGHRQIPWPEPQSPRVLPNGLAAKAQSLGPVEFQGASQRCLQLGACLQSSPPGASPPVATGRRRGTKATKHGSEETRPQSCLVGSATGRPGGEGSPSPKESSLKHRLFRSTFLSTPATAPPNSSKPGPPPQSKVGEAGAVLSGHSEEDREPDLAGVHRDWVPGTQGLPWPSPVSGSGLGRV